VRIERRPGLDLILGAIINPSNSGPATADMVEHGLHHMRGNAQVREPSRDGPADVMQDPRRRQGRDRSLAQAP
jgi:hypothetical protein